MIRDTVYYFVIDTDKPSGNFFREMCAYLTGVIGDCGVGCGEALFSQVVSNTVHSYDHVAINDTVTACDISHVPSANDVYDAVAMSLVCMGANWHDYLGEANRILKPYGMLFVAESLKGNFEHKDRITELANSITEKGFDIISQGLSGGFVYLKALKA